MVRTDEQSAVDVAKAVREALERRYSRRRSSLRNLCYLSAYAVVMICKEIGVDGVEFMCGVFVPDLQDCPAKLEFGNESHLAIRRLPRKRLPHSWVKTASNYIDVTLTQFVREAPRVAVLPMSDIRYVGMVEDIEFAQLVLALCGYEKSELLAVIASAKRVMSERVAYER